MTSASGHLVSDLGDAGEILDREAIAQYRRRRDELSEEIDRASRDNDVGAEQRARAESDALSKQLSAATMAGLDTVSEMAPKRGIGSPEVLKRSLDALVNPDSRAFTMRRCFSQLSAHSCCYAPIQPIRWLL